LDHILCILYTSRLVTWRMAHLGKGLKPSSDYKNILLWTVRKNAKDRFVYSCKSNASQGTIKTDLFICQTRLKVQNGGLIYGKL